MTKKQVKTEHFILDPSFFTSVKRLSEARQVLDDIFNDDNIVIKKSKVVLVSGLRSISNRDTRMDSIELRDVLVGWGMSQKKFLGLFTEEGYDQMLEELLHNYDVIYADELKDPKSGKLVGEIEKIGENSIHKRDFLAKFRNLGAARAYWEQIVCSNIFPSTWIICRSKHLQNIFSNKVKSHILQATSHLKASIKRRHRLHGTLCFLCHNMEAEPLEEFISGSSVALPNGFLNILMATSAEYGLLVVADG